MRLSQALVLVPSLAISLASHAKNEVLPDDARADVPPITVIGPRTPRAEKLAQIARERLIDNLGYWRRLGLPHPPNLEGIFVFSDPSNVSVREILKVLNPDEDVLAHMAEQYQALLDSQLLRTAEFLLGRLPWAMGVPPEEVMTKLFDQYCSMRYGFAVHDTWGAVQEDLKFGETEPFGDSPVKDNAYYGRFPRVNLSSLLKPAASRFTLSLMGSFNAEAIDDAEDEAPAKLYSRRIVILPRTTETADDTMSISSLSDSTIAAHEQGHHVNSSLSFGFTSLDRLSEEVFADNHVVAANEEPMIGRRFAIASKIIAKRLRDKGLVSASEAALAASLENMGQKGYLRSFADDSNIDVIKRHWNLSNPYNGGDPARSFLWHLRTKLSPEERLKFDALTLLVIADLGHTPGVISGQSIIKVTARGTFLEAVASILNSYYLKKFLSTPSPRLKEIEELASETMLTSPQAQAILAQEPDDASLMRKAGELHRLYVQKVVTKDGFNLRVHVGTRVMRTLERWESLAQDRQKMRELVGLRIERPFVQADYILPEIFRAYYRQARRFAPELVDVIVAQAEEAMQSTAVPFTMADGSEEIAFARDWGSPGYWVARGRVESLLAELSERRREFNAIRDDAEPATEAKASALKATRARYLWALERLQEFERTGSVVRLYVPSPWYSTAELGLKVSGKVLGVANVLHKVCSDWLSTE